MEIYETRGQDETFALGQKVGERALAGSVYCLKGDLGAGKTVFAKGMARGLGVEEDVVSPTFMILREYANTKESGHLPFYHFDIYRLQEEEELFDIGFDEYTSMGGICLIEWADQLPGAMPKGSIWIEIEKDPAKGEDYRRITIEQEGIC